MYCKTTLAYKICSIKQVILTSISVQRRPANARFLEQLEQVVYPHGVRSWYEVQCPRIQGQLEWLQATHRHHRLRRAHRRIAVLRFNARQPCGRSAFVDEKPTRPTGNKPFYDLMDAAYCSAELCDHCKSLGHVPLIDHNPRGGEKIEFAPGPRPFATTNVPLPNAAMCDSRMSSAATPLWSRVTAK